MEPPQAKMRIFLGEFEVIEMLIDGFRLKLGPGTSISVHLGDFPHKVKPHDRIPLFTEIPYDTTVTASIQ
jgi:hypothetical protein